MNFEQQLSFSITLLVFAILLLAFVITLKIDVDKHRGPKKSKDN